MEPQRIIVAFACVALVLGGCASDDDAPSDDSPTTTIDNQTPGSQSGDLDRNRSEGTTRPNEP